MKNVLRDRRLELYPLLSLKDFCKSFGIPYNTYWNWENGNGCTCYADRSYDKVRKLCEVLNMTDAEFKEAISNNYQAQKAGKFERVPRKAYRPHSKKFNALTEWRRKENLSQLDAANLLEVSRWTYNAWELGTAKPLSGNLKKIMDLTGLSMHQIASIYTGDKESESEVSYVEKPEQPKSIYSYGEKEPITIEGPNGEVYEDILEPDPDEPEVIASPITPEEFAALNDKEVHEKMDEVITERDENGKPIAGRYIFEDTDGHAKLTREGERKVAEYTAKLRSQFTAASMAEDFVRQKALNEPHDFRDEVIDEVLEKMYGQMDYKKYVYLVGLLGR